jgi:hypothetical protein
MWPTTLPPSVIGAKLMLCCDVYTCMQVDALPEMDEAATTRCAIQCLQSVTDFRGNEIEVGVVAGSGRFRTLNEQDIEDHLTAINEMDS